MRAYLNVKCEEENIGHSGPVPEFTAQDWQAGVANAARKSELNSSNICRKV